MTRPKRERTAFTDDSAASITARLVGEATDALDREAAAASGKKLDGRGKPGGAGHLGTDKRGRAKATYDISDTRQEMARAIAEAEGVAISDVIELAIQLCHEAYTAGKLDFYQMRRPAKSLKSEWKIDVPDKMSIF